MYGFAGRGYIDNNEDQVIVLGAQDQGTLEVTGTFVRFDAPTFDDDGGTEYPDGIPQSIALMVYLYDDSDPAVSDFVRGEGEVDASTGEFRATIANVPDGKSRVILSFIVLDPVDTPTDSQSIWVPEDYSVYAMEVLSNECVDSYLTFTLEWDTPAGNMDLYVTEPGGLEVYGGNHGVSACAEQGQGVSLATRALRRHTRTC